jgi:hypothetical protein
MLVQLFADVNKAVFMLTKRAYLFLRDLPLRTLITKRRETVDRSETMADIFDEITEELKRDRTQEMWTKYGKYIIAAAVAVVGGVALSQGYGVWTKIQSEASASAYNMAIQSENVSTALETALPSLTDGYGMLAKFSLAAAKAEAGDAIGAEQDYLSLSTDKSVDPLYQQAALLLSVMSAGDGADTAELQGRLAPLVGAAGAWQGLALELSAALDLRAGNVGNAKTKLEQILALSEIPADLRQRAARLASMLSD